MSRKYSTYASRSAAERERQYATSFAGAFKSLRDIRPRLTLDSNDRPPAPGAFRVPLPLVVFFRPFFMVVHLGW